MATKGVAVRKRQQIEKAGKTMFIWVAAASVALGIAGVLTVSLVERLMYNQKVLDAKNTTVANLKYNNGIVDKLKDQVRVLNTDKNLLETPRPENSEPVSVILDALPSKANSSALGASLQQRILNDGVTIESLNVDSIGVDEDGQVLQPTEGIQENNFTFTVSATSDQVESIQKVLNNLERSIRTFRVDSVVIEQQNSRVSLSVKGVAYYLPEKKVELIEKNVSAKR